MHVQFQLLQGISLLYKLVNALRIIDFFLALYLYNNNFNCSKNIQPNTEKN